MNWYELELWIDIDMLLMVEKEIRGGICHAMHWNAAANNKYTKHYNKDKKSSYIMCLDTNNLYGWAMSQKLPADGFESKKDISELSENFIKNYDGNSYVWYIVDVNYPERLHNFHNDLPFLPERMKVKNATSLYAICTQ